MSTDLPPSLVISERDFLAMVVELAGWMGWKTYHPWLSVHSSSGYPDLTLLRGPRLLVAEVKREGKMATAKQREWLDAFAAAGVETRVWYPSDFDAIAATLAKEGR